MADRPRFDPDDPSTYEAWLPFLDGAWSSQTKGMLAVSGARALNLDKGWAQTPPRWTCPCCSRSKPEIARVSEAGVLVCNLAVHHDHFWDHAWERITEVCSGLDTSALMTAFGRFEATAICVDCNNADLKARSALLASGVQLPDEFSFPPSAIGRFIVVNANADHVVDAEAAAREWEIERPAYEGNRALVENLLSHFKTNGIRTERSSLARDLNMIFPRYLAALGDRDIESLRRDLEKVIKNSVSRGGYATTRNVTARVPTKAQIDAYIARKRFLEKTLASVCGCCARPFRDSIRFGSKGGEPVGYLFFVAVPIEERDATSLDMRTTLYLNEGLPFVVAGLRSIPVCNDCGQAGRQLAQSDNRHSAAVLTVADLRDALIEAPRNGRAEFDFGMLAEAAVRNAPLKAAIKRFKSHVDFAGKVRSRVESGFFDRRPVRYDLLEMACAQHDAVLAMLKEPEVREWLVFEFERIAATQSGRYPVIEDDLRLPEWRNHRPR